LGEFYTQSPVDTEQVLRYLCFRAMRQAGVKKGDVVDLILDDSPARKRGKKIQGAGTYFDAAMKGLPVRTQLHRGRGPRGEARDPVRRPLGLQEDRSCRPGARRDLGFGPGFPPDGQDQRSSRPCRGVSSRQAYIPKIGDVKIVFSGRSRDERCAVV
jgi:hypothetical protein